MPEDENLMNMEGPAVSAPKRNGNSVEPDTLQEILAQAVGNYVVVEFLIGTQNTVRKEGVLTSVGQSWLVLYDETTDTSILGDMFSVKFVTLYKPGVRPRQIAPSRATSSRY